MENLIVSEDNIKYKASQGKLFWGGLFFRFPEEYHTSKRGGN